MFWKDAVSLPSEPNRKSPSPGSPGPASPGSLPPSVVRFGLAFLVGVPAAGGGSPPAVPACALAEPAAEVAGVPLPDAVAEVALSSQPARRTRAANGTDASRATRFIVFVSPGAGATTNSGPPR